MVVSLPFPSRDSCADSLITDTSEHSDISFSSADLDSSDPDCPLHSTLLDVSEDPVEMDPLVDLGYGAPCGEAPGMEAPECAPLRVGPCEYAATIQDFWPRPSGEFHDRNPDYHLLYSVTKQFNLPNYLGARFEVPSDLNCTIWDDLLVGYEDSAVATFLRYGWPSSYTAPAPPTPTYKNHPSALAHTADIDRFLAKEVGKGAMLGPFKSPPFVEWTQVSPLMTVPKKDSTARRVIIDLSYPIGHSVNSGVAKNFFQGSEFTYTLPTIHDMATRVTALGPGSYMWKTDLERAYRQLRSDPLDYPLMCIKHKDGYFIDVCPSFGCRGSSAAQQRVSRAVCYLMQNKGFEILAYIDDFCGVHGNFHDAMLAFAYFESLCAQLGLVIAPEKSAFPSTRIEWLGFIIDSVRMEVTIPPDKLREVLELTTAWRDKRRASKRDLQSLAGKLNHIGQCVLPARKFMCRILRMLRAAPPVGMILLSPELHRDIHWFNRYASTCNGKLLLKPDYPVIALECDACLDGAGGFSQSQFYSFEIPSDISDCYHISQIEGLNIVVAIKTLISPSTRNTQISITTDNIAAMFALNSGKTRDPVLAACSREIWLIAAVQELTIVVSHAPGKSLVLADALSRRHASPTHAATAARIIDNLCLTEITASPINNAITNEL